MPRAPFQVLAIPYIINKNNISYCIFQRSDSSYWQGISGGGEDMEKPEEAVLREIKEEANISPIKLTRLQTISSIPVYIFRDSNLWGNDFYVILEYCFGIQIENADITISCEHDKYLWCNYDEAYRLLKYDSNRTALWELNQKIQGKGPRE